MTRRRALLCPNQLLYIRISDPQTVHGLKVASDLAHDYSQLPRLPVPMSINHLSMHIVIVLLMGTEVNGGVGVALCVGRVPWLTPMTSATTAGWAWTRSGPGPPSDALTAASDCGAHVVGGLGAIDCGAVAVGGNAATALAPGGAGRADAGVNPGGSGRPAAPLSAACDCITSNPRIPSILPSITSIRAQTSAIPGGGGGVCNCELSTGVLRPLRLLCGDSGGPGTCACQH